METIALLLSQIIEGLIADYVNYEIRRKVDRIGNSISQIVAVFDDDGDGVTDREEVMYSFDVSIPDLSDGYCIVNKGDEIGLGLPELRPVDHFDIVDYLTDTITGNSNGYLIDRNADGDSEVYLPLPFDFTGDGLDDWGQVVDSDHNGVPDASDNAPFYPVGSEGYNQIISSEDSGKSLIIVSPDGNISVYDPAGELQYEDFNEAYSLWLQDNAALDKPFAYYSVTEALLLIVGLFAGVSLVGKLFKRRNYHGHY